MALRRSVFFGAAVLVAVLSGVAQAGDPIRIGFSMSLTGALAGGGKAALLAYEVWRDEVNAQGGLLGRKVELVHYDDQSNPANVPAIYTKLLSVDNVDLVVSGYATNQIAPAMPVVMQKNMVFLALFGTAVNDKFGYDKYFQMLPNGVDSAGANSRGFFETAMTMTPKPKRVALVAADAEYAQNSVVAARALAKEFGFEIVYDRSYPPNSVDLTPIMRAIQAAKPEVVYVASYPSDSVAMLRAVNEVKPAVRMFGGGMIGLAYTPIKTELGPLLNGVVSYDVYVPEPTMKFPGIEDFLKRYQDRAAAAGADQLGYFLPPFAYAEMQILQQAVTKTGGIDQNKIGAYIRNNAFNTIVGDVKFAPGGEWAQPRPLFVQYQNVVANDVGQFRQAGKQVILYPPEFKSGSLIYPFSDIKR
ncbi:MAG: amino acid ABC transporter substrate-binding protein [Bradyrhizobiaceae bacterium]|nr:amino acid ABC transporter substrate-binding protein [Bradyrhizobiaceae bacterium]